MGTVIRPQLSVKNPYWLEKHRYYELKHFCMQYPYWRKQLEAITELRAVDYGKIPGGGPKNLVQSIVESRMYYEERLAMVKNTADETDRDLGRYLLEGVTSGLSYERLNSRVYIPCSKDEYYRLYRRFFWLLDKSRK